MRPEVAGQPHHQPPIVAGGPPPSGTGDKGSPSGVGSGVVAAAAAGAPVSSSTGGGGGKAARSLPGVRGESKDANGAAPPTGVFRRSCNSCTSRKVRCDGATPSCGRCLSKDTVCIYSAKCKSGPKSKKQLQQGEEQGQSKIPVVLAQGKVQGQQVPSKGGDMKPGSPALSAGGR
ncbi:unnamed protein product [Discosporangium mesarthrocarpum]